MVGVIKGYLEVFDLFLRMWDSFLQEVKFNLRFEGLVSIDQKREEEKEVRGRRIKFQVKTIVEDEVNRQMRKSREIVNCLFVWSMEFKVTNSKKLGLRDRRGYVLKIFINYIQFGC